MMKLRALFLILAALFAVNAWAAPNFYWRSVSASGTNTAVTFGFAAFNVVLVNDGASSQCHYTVKSSVATTSDPLIKATEFFNLPLTNAASALGIICNSGQTATIRVYAW